MTENGPTKPSITQGDLIKPAVFEPFQDRLSRDIRNGLSRALSQALAEGDMAPIETLAESLIAQNLSRCYCAYIESRLERYRQAFTHIHNGQKDPFRQGLILWDLQLFFEVHEVLEHAWYHALGNRKLLLQAMIRAAGVYIKLEYGYTRQAAKMADKAREVLEKNVDVLREYFAPEELLIALRTLNPVPPILLKTKDTNG